MDLLYNYSASDLANLQTSRLVVFAEQTSSSSIILTQDADTGPVNKLGRHSDGGALWIWHSPRLKKFFERNLRSDRGWLSGLVRWAISTIRTGDGG